MLWLPFVIAVVAGALLLSLLLPKLRQRLLPLLLLRAADSSNDTATVITGRHDAPERSPTAARARGKGGGAAKGISSSKTRSMRYKGAAGGGGGSAASAFSGAAAAGTSSAHALKLESLKGISKYCTAAAVAPNGRVAAAASSDATVHLFDLGGGFVEQQQQQQRPHIVSNIQGGDSFTALDFVYGAMGDSGGPASGASPLIRIAGALENVQKLVILELRKVETGKRKSLCEIYRGEVALQKNRVVSLVASRGPWIFTASEEDDTEIHVWSLGGELLASVDTKQVLVYGFVCSPSDGRFCAIAAWAPGVKIYEVNRDSKKGFVGKLSKAMDLKSRRGTRCVAISFDNRRAVTVEKKQSGGKASLWNIDVRYSVSEEPRLLGVISLALDANTAAEQNDMDSTEQQPEALAADRQVARAASAAGEKQSESCYGGSSGASAPSSTKATTCALETGTTSSTAGTSSVAGVAGGGDEAVIDEEKAFREQVSLLSFSADGKYLVCAADRHLRFIRLKQQEGDFGERPESAFSHATIAATVFNAHQHPIHTLLVPQCGDFVLTASLDSRPHLWRLPSTMS